MARFASGEASSCRDRPLSGRPTLIARMDQFIVALRAPGMPVVMAAAAAPASIGAAPRELSDTDRRDLLRRHLSVLGQLAQQVGMPMQVVMRRALVWEAGEIVA